MIVECEWRCQHMHRAADDIIDIPLVSIVIPTYNRPDLLLGRSLPSALAQTHRNIEVLVVGDGTDQRTVYEVEKLCAEDVRVRFWNLPHRTYPQQREKAWLILGIDALNHGLEQARGSWVMALGDDDAVTPDMVEVLLAHGEGADVVYGQSVLRENGLIRMIGTWPPITGAFCDGANIRRNQGYYYDPACLARGVPEDADLWDRMRGDGRRFTLVPRVVHYYFPHGGN